MKSKIIKRCLCNIVSVQVDYSLSGKIQYKAASENYIVEDTVYGENVEFLICIKPEETEGFIKDITDLTNGKVKMEVVDNKYIDMDI